MGIMNIRARALEAEKKNSQTGQCPVDHTAFLRARTPTKPQSTSESQENTCSDSKFQKKPIYNVYGEEINPDNLMPINPNQLPVAGQNMPLSTQRAKSNIPKGGTTSDTWTYPSPQMFFSALSRKNKTDGIKEEDIETVVNIHNNMNEHTWNEVMRWENKYSSKECPVSLLKFRGRPNHLSPTARLRSWFGTGLPFDRHDWMVDRCGKEVRYIIDYYYDEPTLRRIKDLNPSNITVHVRPAFDSFQSTYDRFSARMNRFWGRGEQMGGYTSPPPVILDKLPLELEPDPVTTEEWKYYNELTEEKVNELSKQVYDNCEKLLSMSLDPNHEGSSSEVYTALEICVGRFACLPTTRRENVQTFRFQKPKRRRT
jgi:cytochrome c heme-lyase